MLFCGSVVNVVCSSFFLFFIFIDSIQVAPYEIFLSILNIESPNLIALEVIGNFI